MSKEEDGAQVYDLEATTLVFSVRAALCHPLCPSAKNRWACLDTSAVVKGIYSLPMALPSITFRTQTPT
jgi:hypothetical protein